MDSYFVRHTKSMTVRDDDLDQVREITPYEAENLRIARPRCGTIMRWKACGDGLEALVERNLNGGTLEDKVIW